ncbi:MAG: C13 family peptidase [Desulfamplus sp.]
MKTMKNHFNSINYLIYILILILIAACPSKGWSINPETNQVKTAKAPIEDIGKSERDSRAFDFRLLNLIPFKPSGWSGKIVVSNTKGTNIDDKITSEDDIYIDWAVLNDSDVDISSKFYTAVYIDGVYLTHWFHVDGLPANYYANVIDYYIGSLSAGVHTIKIDADYTGVVGENNETDNQYIKTITVSGLPKKSNLTPYRPSSWTDKIVVSASMGSNIDDKITSDNDIYVDWAVINNGDINMSSQFYTALYIDGDFFTNFSTDKYLQLNGYAYVEDYKIGRLSSGIHTIKIINDYTKKIDETDETDNFYIKNIKIFPPLKKVEIDSVYPSVGKMGGDLKAAIKGSGFDENTRVSMSVDYGNSALIIGSIDTSGDAQSVTVVGSTAYIADGGGSGLQVVDISNPAMPKIIGSIDTSGDAQSVTVVGSTAYIADGGVSGLQVVDISNPAMPKIIGSIDTPGQAKSVTIAGSMAYIADGVSGLQVVDISNPAMPKIIGSIDTPGYARSVTIAGSTAYIADGGSGLQVVDIYNPENPQIIASLDTPGDARSVTIAGSTAYIADGDSGLQMVDISNPKSPQIIGLIDTPGNAYDVTIAGSTAYIADGGSGLQMVDISNPKSPQIIGLIDTPGNAYDVTIAGSTAYIADGVSGLQVVNISNPENLQIIGCIDTPGYVEDVTITGSTAYIADGVSGLQVVDISNPDNPQIIGSIDTPGYAQSVTVVGSTAYIADGDSGLQVVDISNPDNPQIIASLDTPGDARSVTIAGSTAYIADGDSGLQVVDISNPENPQIIGLIDTPGDAYDVTVAGSTAYIAAAYSGLQMVDISNPENPQIIGSIHTHGNAQSVDIVGSIAYIANSNGFSFLDYLSDFYDFFSCYDSGLQVVDISNPENPQIIGFIDTPGSAKSVTIAGSTAYIADSSSGLQMVDISDPKNPIIIGSVDTSGSAQSITVIDNKAYIADGDGGLIIVPVPIEVNPTLIDSNTLEAALPPPQIEGNYNLRVFNNTCESSELRGAVSFFKDEDYEQKSEMKAVIVLGGKYAGSAIWEETRFCANFAYNTLLSQGYTHENIYYLSDEDVDVDKDGFNDVDASAASDNFSYALNEWSLDASGLFIYMVDHGGNGTFFLNKTERYFKAADLDTWLDNLQQSMAGRVVVVYDACYSGSFIPILTPPPGKERIVLTSASADESAWFNNQGTLSFSYQFWASAYSKGKLYDAYLDAKYLVEKEQTPMLDADGNGVGPDTADQRAVSRVEIGRGRSAASLPPEILEVSQDETLSGSTSAQIWAEIDVDALSSISRVFAVVKSPEVDLLPTDQAVADLPEIELADINAGSTADDTNTADGIFEGSYNDFKFKGVYTLYVYAVDKQGIYSVPGIIKINKTEGLNPNPAAPAIKILTDSSPSCSIASGGYVRVFGSDGINTLNVESGAKVECVNFPGQNQIIINEASSNFTVKRSGAVVTLQSATAGTMVKVPATTTNQTINFTSDSRSFKLVIINSGSAANVMLGGLEVGLSEVQI